MGKRYWVALVVEAAELSEQLLSSGKAGVRRRNIPSYC